MNHFSIPQIDGNMRHTIRSSVFVLDANKEEITWFHLCQAIIHRYFDYFFYLLLFIKWQFQTIEIINHIGESAAIYAFPGSSSPKVGTSQKLEGSFFDRIPIRNFTGS